MLNQRCELPGLVGREERVHRFLLERWVAARSVPTARRSATGAHVGERGPKLLLGHGDEIGFAVKHILEDGFLFISTRPPAFLDREYR